MKRTHESGGVMATNTREGFRSEAFARFALSAFGPATDVEVEDDHGVDLLCATATVAEKRLRVGESYLVQVKSEALPVTFSGPHSHAWLAALGSPLMICVVDKGAAHLKMYTTWNLSRFLMQHPAWGGEAPESITLIPDAPIGEEEIIDNAIGLGPPIIDFSITELADTDRRWLLRDCIAEWVRKEHENLNRRKMGLTIALGYSQWAPNSLPNPLHLIRHHCSGPHGANGAHRLIAEAATLIALLEKRGGGKKGERDMLASYLKEFTEFEVYEALWSKIMDI